MCQISGHYKLSNKCPIDPWNLDSGQEGLSHSNPVKPRFYLMMLLHTPLQNSQHIRNPTAAAVVLCIKVDKKETGRYEHKPLSGLSWTRVKPTVDDVWQSLTFEPCMIVMWWFIRCPNREQNKVVCPLRDAIRLLLLLLLFVTCGREKMKTSLLLYNAYYDSHVSYFFSY